MAPVNIGKVIFTCRVATCGKNFTDRSNRDRHEKRFNHKPLKRKSKRTFYGKEIQVCYTWMPYNIQIQREYCWTYERLCEAKHEKGTKS